MRLFEYHWRLPICQYADTIGAWGIVAKLEGLAQEDPVAWAISPQLNYCDRTGTAAKDYQA
jgi:3-hydroxyacyl-CoA dehydrogenase